MPAVKELRLSPTTGLNLYNDCKRCFWLHYNANIQRPRGIFPSLPGGMDNVIKIYFDKYRGSLPPELKNKIKGNLVPDMALINSWRNWRTGLEYKDAILNATLFGALDDCLIHEGEYIPLDYKTKGSAPGEGDGERYYQTQLDAYALLLESNGYRAADFAYLVYYYPDKVEANGTVTFSVEPIMIKTSALRAQQLFEDAVKTARGNMPEETAGCEYCAYRAKKA